MMHRCLSRVQRTDRPSVTVICDTLCAEAPRFKRVIDGSLLQGYRLRRTMFPLGFTYRRRRKCPYSSDREQTRTCARDADGRQRSESRIECASAVYQMCTSGESGESTVSVSVQQNRLSLYEEADRVARKPPETKELASEQSCQGNGRRREFGGERQSAYRTAECRQNAFGSKAKTVGVGCQPTTTMRISTDG